MPAQWQRLARNSYIFLILLLGWDYGRGRELELLELTWKLQMQPVCVDLDVMYGLVTPHYATKQVFWNYKHFQQIIITGNELGTSVIFTLSQLLASILTLFMICPRDPDVSSLCQVCQGGPRPPLGAPWSWPGGRTSRGTRRQSPGTPPGTGGRGCGQSRSRPSRCPW